MGAELRLAMLVSLAVLAAGIGPLKDAQANTDPVRLNVGETLVVQNFYYALSGKSEEVYRWRLHASEVRARLGLAVGRVLKRLPAGEADDALPDVVWECEYPSAKAREADIARLDASHEFDAVEAHMQTLIRQFRRAIFKVDRPG